MVLFKNPVFRNLKSDTILSIFFILNLKMWRSNYDKIKSYNPIVVFTPKKVVLIIVTSSVIVWNIFNSSTFH